MIVVVLAGVDPGLGPVRPDGEADAQGQSGEETLAEDALEPGQRGGRDAVVVAPDLVPQPGVLQALGLQPGLHVLELGLKINQYKGQG